MEKNSKGKRKTKQLVLRPVVRIVIVSILFLLLCCSFYLFYAGKNPTVDGLLQYHYNVDENIDYRVYLKDNDFFEETYLPAGKQYTTELIDYVDIVFDYVYSGSLPASMDYKYDIEATIIGEYENSDSGTAELWSKNYTIKPESKKRVDGSTFNVHENIKINYSDYSRVVDKFKSKFRLAIDAYLDVKLTVSYEGDVEDTDSKIDSSDIMHVKIPLSKTTAKISTVYDKHRTKKILQNNLIVENKFLMTSGIVLGLFTIAIFLMISPKIFISYKSYYLKRLEKIMKEYSEIIVEVESELNFDDLEILDIKTFDDMVDIEEEIKSPILYYEIEKDYESWFVITTDKYLYRYILRR